MRSRDFEPLLKRTPFEPLRVHISSGSYYDVRHPEYVHLGDEGLEITVDPHAQHDARLAHCSWLHVSHVEVLKK